MLIISLNLWDFKWYVKFYSFKNDREQTSFEDALAEAQRLGFAEADPTDDVEGIDAARKVVITSYLSFNQVIKLNDVKVKGISKTTLSDINVADKLGYKIKLLVKVHIIIEKLMHPLNQP